MFKNWSTQTKWIVGIVAVIVILLIVFRKQTMNFFITPAATEGSACTTTGATPKAGTIKGGVCVAN